MDKTELIFEIYKDQIIGDTQVFKGMITKKFKLTWEEIHNLYVKIINYQIDTYGIQLNDLKDYLTKEDCSKRRLTR